MMLSPHSIWQALRRTSPEAYLWAAGLVALACADPAADGLLSLCPLDRLGLAWCPGCGLGHSVAHLFRGDVAASLHAHPLGPFAVAVLAVRIVSLLRDAALSEPLASPLPLANSQ